MKHPTIYLHHDAWTLQGPHLPAVDAQHKKEGYPLSALGHYTFYQFFIEKEGQTIQCRPTMDPTVVYKEVHHNSISICLAGNFDKEVQTLQQREALIILFRVLKRQHGVTSWDIKEHRDYQNVSCPGSRVPKGLFVLVFIASQYSVIERIIHRLLARLRRIKP